MIGTFCTCGISAFIFQLREDVQKGITSACRSVGLLRVEDCLDTTISALISGVILLAVQYDASIPISVSSAFNSG